ncbi:MAG TPA: hypothetical protein VGZ03_08030 [Acidimicrobiales bacterium]|jgi:hypothetical protein|nr:hypothetical protein [Acidimicrobiales bacterium]
MVRSKAEGPDPGATARLARSEEWAGVRAGDAVDVLDDRERGATWRFIACVTNVATGERWVEVVGGRGGEQRRRSFRVDQLYPRGSVRGGVATSAPLDDAPGLPL